MDAGLLITLALVMAIGGWTIGFVCGFALVVNILGQELWVLMTMASARFKRKE